MDIAIIGYGGRGRLYSSLLKENDLNANMVALCDIDKDKLELAKKEVGFKDEQLFDSEEEFFKEKRADILFLCTQDELHYRHALKALRLGYDLLLEKPIAMNVKECREIEKEAIRLQRKVFVCHVLRYSPFFNTIKEELKTGKYGKVKTIAMTENVGYWHQAHSYVRGNWRNDNFATPMIIAKCCHDLDLISWYIDKKCKAVTSFGELSFFNSKNKPEKATKYCLDCPFVDTCEYSAKTIYIKDRAEKGKLNWPCDIIVNEPTVEKLEKALKTSPYGRCVFECDNNVVDHQVVNMQFEDGVTAQLTMTAFAEAVYREIHVHCEHGSIRGNAKDNLLYLSEYGKETKVIDMNKIPDTSYGHGGGDILMLKDVLSTYNGKEGKNLTSISNSMQSHYIGFEAENSRLHDGKVIKIKH